MNSPGRSIWSMLCSSRARRLSRRIPMHKAKFILPILFVAALLAGCGGGGSTASLKSNDIAVVGKVHITKPAFDALMAQAKRSFAQQTPRRPFPKDGPAPFQTVKGQAVTLLVQQAER